MNRMTVLVAMVFMLCGTALAAEMEIPPLSAADYIHWGPEQRVIEVEYNGPMAGVGDWNGDGIKDLLVGVFQAGAIYYYPNSGTNASPLFDERLQLSADGTLINVPYG